MTSDLFIEIVALFADIIVCLGIPAIVWKLTVEVHEFDLHEWRKFTLPKNHVPATKSKGTYADSIKNDKPKFIA